MAGQTRDLRYPPHHIVTAQAILLYHILQVVLWTFQSFNSRDLAGSGRTSTDIFLQLDHIPDHIFRSGSITDTPTGHRIGFGKAINNQGPFFHSRQSSKACISPSIKEDVLIHLISQDHQVLLLGQFGQLEQRFSAGYSSRGVAWAV